MITLQGVTHIYRVGQTQVRAVDAVDLTIPSGSATCLLGPSGSGKSTLLHLIGGVERCQAGHIAVDEWPVSTLGAADLARYRRTYVGFVFQAFHLLPTLTAAENVEVPLVLAGVAPAERRQRALKVLDHVGLGPRAGHRPDQLSGGEQQRVAVARALVHGPRLLLADEPTGNLDSETGARIVELLLGIQREQGCTVVIATHNDALAAQASQRVRMRDGHLLADAESESSANGGLRAAPGPQLAQDAGPPSPGARA